MLPENQHGRDLKCSGGILMISSMYLQTRIRDVIYFLRSFRSYEKIQKTDERIFSKYIIRNVNVTCFLLMTRLMQKSHAITKQ